MCAPFFVWIVYQRSSATIGAIRPHHESVCPRDRLRRGLRGTSGPAGRPDARRPVPRPEPGPARSKVHEHGCRRGRRGRPLHDPRARGPGGQGRAHRSSRSAQLLEIRMVKRGYIRVPGLRGYSTGRPRKSALRPAACRSAADNPRRSSATVSSGVSGANLVRTMWRIMSKPALWAVWTEHDRVRRGGKPGGDVRAVPGWRDLSGTFPRSRRVGTRRFRPQWRKLRSVWDADGRDAMDHHWITLHRIGYAAPRHRDDVLALPPASGGGLAALRRHAAGPRPDCRCPPPTPGGRSASMATRPPPAPSFDAPEAPYSLPRRRGPGLACARGAGLSTAGR